MSEDRCPLADQLLSEIRDAHTELVRHAGAADGARRALDAIRDVLAFGVDGLDEAAVLATPTPEEWSIAEVLEHVAEHDRKYDEFRRLGLDHYIEHGLEHALQLWRLRPLAEPGASDKG